MSEVQLPIYQEPTEAEAPKHWSEYAFDHRLADCANCTLRDFRDETECSPYKPPPEKFNGMMIVGEGPGEWEAREKQPFVGKAGQWLNAFLKQEGIERDRCYITNATLCKPPVGTKSMPKEYPEAILSCRTRLLTEIHYVKPRVIVALGRGALDALVGEKTIKNKRVPWECPTMMGAGGLQYACDGKGQRTRKVWGCTKCKRLFPKLSSEPLPGGERPDPPEKTPCELTKLEGGECKGTEKKPGKWQPRNYQCSTCGGKKTKVIPQTLFKSRFSIGGSKPVAGGVFYSSKLDCAEWFAEPAYIIPTYHPSHLMRPPTTRGEKQVGGQFLMSACMLHLRKAKRLLTEDPVFSLDWRPFHPGQEDELEQWLRDNPGPYSCDLETNAKEVNKVTVIKCCGIDSHTTGRTAVLNMENLPGSALMVQILMRLLSDPDIGKVWQNGMVYDLPVLRSVYGYEGHQNYIGDTMVRHNALYPDEPHNLQHIGFEFTDAEAWKPPTGNVEKQANDEALWEYCAMDCRITTLAFKGMEPELHSEGVKQVDEMDVRKTELAYEMHKNGLPIDRQEQLAVGAQARFEQEEALRWLRQFIIDFGGLSPEVIPKDKGPDGALFNPNSNPQMQWVLYGTDGPLKLVPQSWNDPARTSPKADEAALLKYLDNPFIKVLLEYKRAGKLLSNYVEIPIGVDGRIHAMWNPIGARTGRYSTKEPNAMNWPKWVRAMVRALAGTKLVGSDYDQLELRILGSISGDEELIRKCKYADPDRKLEPEWDPHSYVASLAFGTTFTSLDVADPRHDKKNRRCACETCMRKTLRDGTKATVYGLNYGAGPDKILEQIITRALKAGADIPPVDLRMVRKIVDAYFGAFKQVKRFRDDELESASRTGYLREKMLGRIRMFPAKQVPPTEAANFGIQSFAASVMDWSLWNIYCELKARQLKSKLIAQVHDAIYIESPDEEAEIAADILDRHMNCEIRMSADTEWMPLTAKAEIGETWKDV